MANHPIFTATFHGDAHTVSHLLTEDPELIAIRDAKHLTPLHVAASRGQTGVVQVLLECGADVHGPTAEGEWTPLADVMARDTNQQTPADRAKSHNQRAVTQLLEKHVAK